MPRKAATLWGILSLGQAQVSIFWSDFCTLCYNVNHKTVHVDISPLAMKALILFTIFLLYAFSPKGLPPDDGRFIGTWKHAESNREIRVQLDEADSSRYTIFDSTRDKKGKLLGSEDIYRAFRQDDKLVMPASRSPRCPYCEIQQEGQVLRYICNHPFDMESNFLRTDQPTDTLLFSKTLSKQP